MVFCGENAKIFNAREIQPRFCKTAVTCSFFFNFKFSLQNFLYFYGKLFDMKKYILLFGLLLGEIVFGQGASISLVKKSTQPVEVSTGQTFKVNDVVFFKLGLNLDGSFRFVQDLNNFNEPIQPSKSRTSMMKQPIKFFKTKDGVVYAFTKYFVVNLEAALLSKEVEILPSEK